MKIKVQNCSNLILIALIILLSSCKKFVDTNLPADRITATGVFSNDASAIAGIGGVYYTINNIASSSTIYPTLFSDEITIANAGGLNLQAQENSYDPTSADFNFWTNYYKAIYAANAILENVDNSTITDSVKTQVKGEAKFLRAFSNFKLLNFYGNIPLITTTNVKSAGQEGNKDQELIYKAIIDDLNDATTMVSSYYPSASRARANKSVVNALLAKVYLYHREWSNAEATATKVISASTTYNLNTDLNAVFLKRK